MGASLAATCSSALLPLVRAAGVVFLAATDPAPRLRRTRLGNCPLDEGWRALHQRFKRPGAASTRSPPSLRSPSCCWWRDVMDARAYAIAVSREAVMAGTLFASRDPHRAAGLPRAAQRQDRQTRGAGRSNRRGDTPRRRGRRTPGDRRSALTRGPGLCRNTDRRAGRLRAIGGVPACRQRRRARRIPADAIRRSRSAPGGGAARKPPRAGQAAACSRTSSPRCAPRAIATSWR